MRKLKLIYFMLFVIYFVVACVQGGISSDINKTDGEGDINVDNTGNIFDLLYSDIDRILTEEDFAFLERGISLKEIEAVVGRPNGVAGFNVLTPVYFLENGKLFLHFDNPFSTSFDSLLSYAIRYSDGSGKRVDFDNVSP